MKLLAGNSNPALAKAIGDYLDAPLTRAQVRRFADNEVFVAIDENVRGEDVFIIQSTSYPANDHLMELLICTDALVRASARRITPARSRASSTFPPTTWWRSRSWPTTSIATLAARAIS